MFRLAFVVAIILPIFLIDYFKVFFEYFGIAGWLRYILIAASSSCIMGIAVYVDQRRNVRKIR